MRSQYIYPSLTRISDLAEKTFSVKKIGKSKWETGDYVVCRIQDPGSNTMLLELRNGRMRGVIGGEYLVGALGERYATLEATGTWKKVKSDGKMSVLTGAGLLGKLTSKSAFIPNIMQVKYKGHVHRNNKKITMDDFVPAIEDISFNTPVILFVGTSMSAGKTTSARIVANIFKSDGYKVVGAKLSGAGRYKDILAIKDVGVDAVFDFVDVGLPSSICSPEIYNARLRKILNLMAGIQADVAIVEVGASPLEPYNSDLAIESLRDQIKCVVLSASDPYAVYGIMTAFDIVPDIVTGISTNTLAGIEMVEQLCEVKALNLIDPKNTSVLKKILSSKTGLKL
jgi:hypothetical protein